MDLGHLLHLLIPSWTSVAILGLFFTYLAVARSILPGKLVPGAVLQDGSRLYYRCNGLISLLVLSGLLGAASKLDIISRTVIGDIGLELLSTTFLFSFLVTLALYAIGCKSSNCGSSLKPHVSGNLLDDWWFGIQLNPQFMGIDLKFFFVRAGMMGWLFINLSVFARSLQEGTYSQSMLYILDYFIHEEYMTSTCIFHLQIISVCSCPPWTEFICPVQFILLSSFISMGHNCGEIGLMLVFGDLVSIPFTFSILGWWLLTNKVELRTVTAIANCFTFVIGYLVFRGANKQKHVFKKDPKALIWGKPSRVIGGKLLASGYWGIARHCNYLGDLLLALSFSLPCGLSSPVPYFYPIYLLILLLWRERRDEARCAEKYREIWAEYCRLVPWRILPYVY